MIRAEGERGCWWGSKKMFCTAICNLTVLLLMRIKTLPVKYYHNINVLQALQDYVR